MFQLILGISLGLILLFVVVLLIAEMAATYPVWKHFNQPFSSRENHPENGNNKERPGLKYTFLALGLIPCFVIISLLIGNACPDKKANIRVKAETINQPALAAAKKYLADSLPQDGLLFTTLMKWEDGKLYCNNRVMVQKAVSLSFSDCHYSLLDKDGFLIRDFHLSQNDFVADIKAGRVAALFNRSNAGLGFNEYQRIVHLQVVLDKKTGR